MELAENALGTRPGLHTRAPGLATHTRLSAQSHSRQMACLDSLRELQETTTPQPAPTTERRQLTAFYSDLAMPQQAARPASPYGTAVQNCRTLAWLRSQANPPGSPSMQYRQHHKQHTCFKQPELSRWRSLDAQEGPAKGAPTPGAISAGQSTRRASRATASIEQAAAATARA